MEAKIRRVLAANAQLAVDPLKLDRCADLHDLGLTSAAAVRVLLALEDVFEIEFPDEAIDKSTFASLANLEQAISRALK